MKKIVTVLVLAALAIGLLGLAGCGSSGGTATQPTEEKTTAKTDEGTKTDSGRAVTVDEVGFPVYPGAKLNENASMKVSGTENGSKVTYSVAQLWTNDPADKVIAWYKSELSGEPNFMDLSMQGQAMFIWGSGTTARWVSVGPGMQENTGKTVIAGGSGTVPGGIQPTQ